jgi:Bacterial mobilisation protein (MobC)
MNRFQNCEVVIIIQPVIMSKPEPVDILEGKTKRVEVRMSKRELKIIDASAKKANLNRSEYLRLRGQKKVYMRALPRHDYDTLTRNYRELRAQGNNLNQIAKALNTALKTGDRVNFDANELKTAIEANRTATQAICAALK